MEQTIAVIGTGHIGGFLASAFTNAGHHVVTTHAIESDRDRIAPTDIVVLALPWLDVPAVAAALDARPRIIIDATNPFDRSYQVVPPDAPFRSAGEQNAARFPHARVVKAFNSFSSDLLAALGHAEAAGRTALPMCGDDTEAKRVVSALIADIGFTAFDLGPLANAALQEPGGFYYGRAFTADELRNGERARAFATRVLAAGDTAAFDEVVADDVVVTSGIRPFEPMIGKAAFGAGLATLAAFSNATFTLEDLIPAGDRVTLRYTAVADHTGDQLGVPPTNYRIVMREIRLMRFRDGRLVEDFVADINYDWPWLVAPAFRERWLREKEAG